MCRLFGMSAGEHAASATFWLLQAPDSLTVQSHREPDGTGLGWFDGEGRAHVSKQAIAAYQDTTFAHRAHDLHACTFVAHIRFASTGSLQLRNTHPFEQQHRLFAHNGVIEDLAKLDEHLGEDRSLVKGDTDSERFFALITREIDAHDGDVQAGIVAACRWIAEQLPLYAINFVLVAGERLWALRYPATHELYVLERRPGERLEHNSSLGSRVRSEDARERPLVVVASERMDDDPAWRALACGELLSVSPQLDVRSDTILPSAPAHPLTLSDLGAQAQRSQARPGPAAS